MALFFFFCFFWFYHFVDVTCQGEKNVEELWDGEILLDL